MTSDNLFEEIFGKRVGDIRPGLERIQSVLKSIPELFPKAPSVLIGGTNGKGSTAGFTWQLLAGLGQKTGLYSSPHLIHFSERIQVSGERIDDQKLFRLFGDLKQILGSENYSQLTFFEIATLLGFYAFNQFQTEFNVVEVGLGGRLDATNILNPDASIITSIGLDHMDLLGQTTAEIAAEKCGILRPMRPLFFGGRGSCDASAYKKVHELAAQTKCPVFELDREIFYSEAGSSIKIALPLLNPVEFKIPISLRDRPDFLLRNFSLACATVYYLTGSQEDLKQSVLSLEKMPTPPTLRGRFEIHHHLNQKVIFDVCHNVHGARVFVEGLKKSLAALKIDKCPGVVSILRDKDVSGIVAVLRDILDPIVFYKIPNERSLDDGTIRKIGLQSVIKENFMDAFATVSESSPKSPIVVCGSVAAVGNAMSALGRSIL